MSSNIKAATERVQSAKYLSRGLLFLNTAVLHYSVSSLGSIYDCVLVGMWENGPSVAGA